MDLFAFMGPKYISYVLDYVGESEEETRVKFFSDARMVKIVLKAADDDVDFAEMLGGFVEDFSISEVHKLSAALDPKLFEKLMAVSDEGPIPPDIRKQNEKETPNVRAGDSPAQR